MTPQAWTKREKKRALVEFIQIYAALLCFGFAIGIIVVFCMAFQALVHL